MLELAAMESRDRSKAGTVSQKPTHIHIYNMRSTSLLSLLFLILILSHVNLDAKPDKGSMNSVHLINEESCGKTMKGHQQGSENKSDKGGFEDEDYIYTQSVP
ncbi:unnamed protein product [Lactuca virosa]|uniref:Transmembrane protein n=1 Tax=Lactuca virosa TaxID=75947 RepID=A0AAU9NG85_9ASTR|nr:unnamed protein product [Lactuca virosa]